MKTNTKHKSISQNRSRVLAIFALIILAHIASPTLALESRIKDIAHIAGLESIPLIGYGIVIGLNGSGDKDIELTKQTMANLLENFHISIPTDDIKSKNVAAVIITASARPFHKKNHRVDVVVSSVGDAISLGGGILLMTPLLDPNGEVYALAQGSLTIGGFSAGSSGEGGKTVEKNHTTTGIVPSGAILKYGQTGNLYKNGMMQILLRNPDFTTADRMAAAINKTFGGIAVAEDASAIKVKIPEKLLRTGQTASFMAQLEMVTLNPDTIARIIVNERTGTIVMGGAVNIGEAVVAHGNLTVTIKSTLYPSQPQAIFNRGDAGDTVITEDVRIKVKEDHARVMMVPETTTVRDLANTLNLMGATPRDLISILEALRRLGAIQMELIAM